MSYHENKKQYLLSLVNATVVTPLKCLTKTVSCSKKFNTLIVLSKEPK